MGPTQHIPGNNVSYTVNGKNNNSICCFHTTSTIGSKLPSGMGIRFASTAIPFSKGANGKWNGHQNSAIRKHSPSTEQVREVYDDSKRSKTMNTLSSNSSCKATWSFKVANQIQEGNTP
jgi:hypothetical protein